MEIYDVLLKFALSISLTLLFELTLALAFKLRGRELLLVALVNILTNPAVVFTDMLLRELMTLPAILRQLPLEALAVLAEGLCYSKFSDKIRHPWGFSLMLNAISYSLGLLLNYLI